MSISKLSNITLSRKLKLSQLMVFEKVLKCGSFVRAANEIGLTQPAVTKAIFDLESFFETTLFERSNRGVVPTEFGVMIGRRVKSLIAEMRYMTEEVNAFRSGESGHIFVGTLISASAQLLPQAIARLREAAPGVTVTIREGPSSALFPALATGDLDIVVGRLPEKELPLATAFPLQHEVLFEESFSIVCGKKNPMAERPELRLADLLNSSWILPLPESPSRNAAEQLFRNVGLPMPKYEVESLSLLVNLGILLETDMVALLPRAAAVQFANAGLLAILDLPVESRFGTVGYSIRADREVNPACRRFIDSLRAAAKAIG